MKYYFIGVALILGWILLAISFNHVHPWIPLVIIVIILGVILKFLTKQTNNKD